MDALVTDSTVIRVRNRFSVGRILWYLMTCGVGREQLLYADCFCRSVLVHGRAEFTQRVMPGLNRI